MKIRNRIVLSSFLWLICILLCVNGLVYFLFIRIATSNETDTLRHKAAHMLFREGPEILIQPNQEKRLQSFLIENSMIRTIDAKSHVVNLLFNNPELTVIEPKKSDSFESELYSSGEHRMLIVRVPIVKNEESVGTLEISELLISLDESIRILISIILISMVGAAILALFGGIALSKLVLGPITNLIFTMEEIEGSLAFKKIPLTAKPKDELYQMTATFNRLMERIGESFNAQQRFVSDASHELKTTLTIIESYASMLRRWGIEDRELQKEAVDTIHSEAIRMRKMTQQLLDLASLEKARIFHPEPLELVAFCRQIARLIGKIHKRQVDVQTREAEIMLYADKMKLKQLMLILLDNALKYSSKTIEVKLHSESAGVFIAVKDYGIGIPPDDLGHVFERFYRVDKARTRKSGGTGLGLPIAKAIVLEHRGTIKIVSEEGQWSEINVFLPWGEDRNVADAFNNNDRV